MDWLLAPFSHGFMIVALVAAVCLGISGGLVGSVLVARRTALATDALAHSLLPGLAIACAIAGLHVWSLLAGAVIAALLASLAAAVVSRLTRLSEEAALAACAAVFFAGGLLLLRATRAAVDVQHILFGDLLGCTGGDAVLAASVATGTVAVVVLGYRAIVLECFDPVFHRSIAGGRASMLVYLGLMALAVLNLVAAVRLLGVVLTMGLFVLPALSAALWCRRWSRQLPLAAGLGVLGAVGGLWISYHLGQPSGPCIVVALGAVFAVSLVASPQGMLARLLPSRRHLAEDGDELCAVPDAPPAALPPAPSAPPPSAPGTGQA